MEKRHGLSIVTLICYVIMVGGGALLGYTAWSEINGLSESSLGIGGAFAGLALSIVMILALAYAAIGILPIIFKIIHLFADSKVPAALCIIFDIAYIAINALLIFSAIKDGTGSQSIMVFCGLALLSVVALITNIASMTD